MLTDTPASPVAHWLLTSPGVRLIETTYTLNGSVARAKLSPVALLKLLPEEKRPQQVLALVTEEAGKEALGYLEEEAGAPVVSVAIPEGTSPGEIWEILARILAAVPPGIRLTLDITHGFRSLPFVYLTAALFLTSLRDVRIEGVYYGMLEAGEKDGARPLVDLSVVLNLAEWFYATRMFRETGQAHDLVRLLSMQLTRSGAGKQLILALAEFTWDYTSGLPLELGQAAEEICRVGTKVEEPVLHVPAGEELLRAIIQAAEPFRLVAAGGAAYQNKKEIALDLSELKRQARLIDLYLERGQFATATQLIREWMVSRVLLEESNGDGPDRGCRGWLDYRPTRASAEARLNVLTCVPSALLTPAQARIRDWWQRLGNARNEVAHCGFRRQPVDVAKQLADVVRVWQQVREHIEDGDFWNVRVRTGDGILLVSPVGHSAGALYTALKKVQPRWLLPIVSRETAARIGEICAAAGFAGETLPPLVMNDPYLGYDEIRSLVANRQYEKQVAPELAGKLVNGSEIIVNLTGGTTVMQQLAQKVADVARNKLGLKTRTVAVVDRRCRQEQESNPYVEGELVWLDDDRS
ncbi:MAG: TIGR02221 family CRISPR-associated protein [Limnochordales bacterium]|nr:TIGR02221 family CRISPR-associated protein [Limnochordales bacterium]